MFADRLKKYRKAAGLTQRDMAKNYSFLNKLMLNMN